MRKLFALMIVALAAVFAAPSSAIVNGTVDTQHTYVGLITFYDASGVYEHRCTGTLISPTVVLTAGHCTYGMASAQVWFETGPIPAGAYPLDPVESRPPCTGFTGFPCTGGLEGTPNPYPGFAFPGIVPPEDAAFPNTGDVGVVVLSEPVDSATYGVLAPAGSLDALATKRGTQTVTFTIVGYGLQQEVGHKELAERTRYVATTQLVSLRSALTAGFNLHMTANGGNGRGATCFGDSGGPIFYDATNVIVAVTSFGHKFCVGSDYAFRIDQQKVLDWIVAFDPSHITVARTLTG
jgi:secreted trypsin-like serine protease